MKLGITRKIMLIIIIIVFLSLVGISINILFIQQMGETTQKLYNHPFTVSQNVLLADKNIMAMHRSMKDVVLAENSEEIDRAIAAVENSQKSTLDNFVIIKRQILGEEGKSLALTAEDIFIEWESIREEVITLYRKGQNKSAAQITKGKGHDHVVKLEKSMNKMLEYARSKADQFMIDASNNLQGTIISSILIALATLIISVTIGFLFSRSLSAPILKATQDLNTTSAQILASVQEQATNTKEQATSIQETTTTMDEISQAGKQMAERANQVSRTAESGNESINSGTQAVKSTTDTMESIRQQVELVAENIVSLSEKTMAISEIITTVNDIAEQSNLLALNASIEAVSAGEHGQRFSVVAGEIKNLADQAKDSTVQIRKILEDIQTGINTSVMLTEEAVKRVETGKEKADVALDNINQLVGTIQESIEAFQQIVGATNQQQIGLEQVTIALNNINTATEQTAVGINQIEAAVSNLNSLGNDLQKVVHEA